MEDSRSITRTENIKERVQKLGNAVLSVSRISDQFLRRAQRENASDKKVLKLLNYLLSFECFRELESNFFWYYDPENPEEWNEILDHIYNRSMTQNHLMN